MSSMEFNGITEQRNLDMLSLPRHLEVFGDEGKRVRQLSKLCIADPIGALIILTVFERLVSPFARDAWGAV